AREIDARVDRMLNNRYQGIPNLETLAQPNVTCPDSYIKGSDDRCYFAPNIKLQFNNAENVCSDTSSDTHLVSIDSYEENNAIQLISQAAHYTDIFIGLELGASGYAWIDGTSHNYDNFEDRQPNPRAGNCVAMNVTSGKWRSVSCDQTTSFVCLKKYTLYPVSSTLSPTTSATNSGGSCPVDNTFVGPAA
uniref:C-type lectin domain-containing protein n=1 Tax=Panagrolaimus sp. ES5 TaxID=591445 RepID=A0AC34G9Q0_9BILA